MFTKKGKEIMDHFKKEYGDKLAEKVFTASKDKGIIKGVEIKKTNKKHK